MEASFYNKMQQLEVKHQDRMEREQQEHERALGEVRKESEKLVKQIEELELSLSLEQKKAI